MLQFNQRKDRASFKKNFLKTTLVGGLFCSMSSMAQQTGFTIYSWNVGTKLDKSVVRNQIIALQPDIFLIEEADNDTEVSLLKTELEIRLGGTWQVFTHSLTGTSKLAWFSRYPLINTEVIKYGYIQKALLKVQVVLEGQVFNLFGLHARTASSHSTHAIESDTFLSAIKARTNHVRTIVVGDFNSRSVLDGAVTSLGDTTYSSLGFSYPTTYSTDNFTKAGYLDSWRVIKGALTNVEATKMPPPWETSGSNFNERIDYIFVSSDLRSSLLGAGIYSIATNEMSDHKPIWVRIAAGGVTTKGGVQAKATPTIKNSSLATDNSVLNLQFTGGVYASSNQTGALTIDHFELTFERHVNGQASSCHIKSVEHVPGSDRAKVFLLIEGIPNGNETIKLHLAGANISAQNKLPRHFYNMNNVADHWSRIRSGSSFASTVHTKYHKLNLVVPTVIPMDDALMVNIEQATYQTDPVIVNTPIFFTVKLSQPVIDFSAHKFSLTGDARATKLEILKESETTYGVMVSGMRNKGTVILNLPAGVLHDRQGRANELSTSNDNIVTYLGAQHNYNLKSSPE